VAAAGRHQMLFHGPPGVGKTMLAERVPGLLPDLEVHDALEVSAVHSLAGFNLADELITRPPYSDPHHSASVASIVGGGQRMAKSGAISCAHATVRQCSLRELLGAVRIVSVPPQLRQCTSSRLKRIRPASSCRGPGPALYAGPELESGVLLVSISGTCTVTATRFVVTN
jgi:hypothetical protein